MEPNSITKSQIYDLDSEEFIFDNGMRSFYESEEITDKVDLEGSSVVFHALNYTLEKFEDRLVYHKIKKKIPKKLIQDFQQMIDISLILASKTSENKQFYFSDDTEPNPIQQETWARTMVISEKRKFSTDFKPKSTKYKLRNLLNNEEELPDEPYKQKKIIVDPIPLAEYQKCQFDLYEEKMRHEKQRQRDILKAKISEESKRKQQLKEAQKQLKNIMVEGMKSNSYTYSYDGSIIPIQSMKLEKLPYFSYSTPFSLVGGEISSKIKSFKRNERRQSTMTKGTIVQNKSDIGKESKASQAQGHQTDVFNELEPNYGVTYKEKERIKEGPMFPKVNDITEITSKSVRMSKFEYLNIAKKTIFNNTLDIRRKTEADFSPELSNSEKEEVYHSYFPYESSNNEEILSRPYKTVEEEDSRIKFTTSKNNIEALFKVDPKEPFPFNVKRQKSNSQRKLMNKNNGENDPINEFNLQILKNRNWGRETSSLKFQPLTPKHLKPDHHSSSYLNTIFRVKFQKTPNSKKYFSFEHSKSKPNISNLSPFKNKI